MFLHIEVVLVLILQNSPYHIIKYCMIRFLILMHLCVKLLFFFSPFSNRFTTLGLEQLFK